MVIFRFEGNPRPVGVSETHPMHAFGNTLIKGPDAPSGGCPTRPRRWHLLHVRGEPRGGGDAAAGGAGTPPPACGKAGPVAPTILPAPLPATGIRYRRSPVLLPPNFAVFQTSEKLGARGFSPVGIGRKARIRDNGGNSRGS
jgi:hypothetical protein